MIAAEQMGILKAREKIDPLLGVYCVTATCCPSMFLAGLVGRWFCSGAYTQCLGYLSRPQTIYTIVDDGEEGDPILENGDPIFGELPFQIEDWGSDRGDLQEEGDGESG